MSKVAAVIITFNEEDNIGRCIESVRFCDEIVVVDSGSSDQTVEIAKKFTTNVQSRKWPGYADQKNFALTLTTCDWVISVDADEEVSPDLAKEIKQKVSGNACDAYSVPRKTIHF